MYAQHPDFVHTSLLVIGPGNEVYTAYGHAALRLQCPSKHLDYCFTFEMALDANQLTRFFVGTPKAGFMAVPTKTFLNQYATEGRSVTQYELNLRPQQEQTLWRNLDQEVAQPPQWEFDVMQHGCAAMVAYMVKKSLHEEYLTYHHADLVLQGNYHDVTAKYSENAPWAKVFWDLKCGLRGWDHAEADCMMMPQLLADTWQRATVDDSEGHSRPLMTGQPQVLVAQTLEVKPSPLSPTVAGVALTMAVIALGAWLYRRYRRKKQ